jgi:hypothetical protein
VRTLSSLRLGIAIFALVLGIASDARGACQYLYGPPNTTAVPPWWVTNWMYSFWEASPFAFGDSEYWHRYQYSEAPFADIPCEDEVLPQRSEHVYVTFGLTAIIRDDDDPEDPVEDDLHTGQLYIGGWPTEFDDDRGGHPGPGDFGILRITGGSLRVGGCTCDDDPESPYYDPNSPACYYNSIGCYERIGYRGTTGTVEQSGGYHEVENSLTFGNGSSCEHPEDPEEICSRGIYRLSGGTLKAPGMHIGRQGLGEFEMTGGHFDSSANNGSTAVGLRYAYGGGVGPTGPMTGPIPGHGIFTQSDGLFEQGVEFAVGYGEGAVGKVTISGDADFRANGHVWVGGGDGEDLGGEGQITQTGGEVAVGQIFVLGAHEGGKGIYTISGGSLAQTGCCGNLTNRGVTLPVGLHVGYLGRGELVVEGSDSTITVAGEYSQGDDSLVTFKLHQAAPNITPIDAHTATFASGAKIKVETVGWTPQNFQSFPILTADSVVGESNVTLDSSSVSWLLYWSGTSPHTLYAEYFQPICGLLGIEPVFVLAFLHARRRWKRGRG